jgi:hypothetical protein
MKTPSIVFQLPRPTLDVPELCRRLRLKTVAENWEVGRLLDLHFGEDQQAKKNEIKDLAKTLKKHVTVSTNHLYKCRQFFALFRKRSELKPVLKRCLKWRRVLRLFGIKRLALGIAQKRQKQSALAEFVTLIASYPKSGTKSEFGKWTDRVEQLRLKLRGRDSKFFYEEKLLTACKVATLYRLDWAAVQFDKIGDFVPVKESKKYKALRGKLQDLIRQFDDSYPDVREKMRKKRVETKVTAAKKT